MSPEDKPGTELVMRGVNPDLHEELLDTQPLINDISQMWFKALERGTTIRVGHVGRPFRKVGPPAFPVTADGKSGVPTAKHRDRIPVSVNHRVVGELEDVSLFVAKEPVPEAIRGIALVKNGTQVIDRLTRWGRRIPIDLQDRLYGWATYYCTAERPFLLKCERPGHRGFTPHTYFTRTLELLQQQEEELLLPLVKQELVPRVTERDRKRAQQNLLVLQQAFAENPGFNPWAGEGALSRERSPRPPPVTPYVSEVKLDRESYRRGDSVRVQIVILNPEPTPYPFAQLTVEGLDDGLSPLTVDDLTPGRLPVLPAARGQEKGRLTAETTIKISSDFSKGRNWVRCTLLNRPPWGEEGSAGLEAKRLDRKGHELWVEQSPPARTHGPPTGGSTGLTGRLGTVQRVNPITEGDLDAAENEIMPFWDVGEFWFYTRGARIAPVYEKQPRTADSVLYELIAEVVSEKVAQSRLDADTRDHLDKAEVLGEFRVIEEARRRFLRSCERFRSAETSS
jgi:hypothetical protein